MNYLGGYESDEYDGYSSEDGGRLPYKSELKGLKGKKLQEVKYKILHNEDNYTSRRLKQERLAKLNKAASMEHKKKVQEKVKLLKRNDLVKGIEHHLEKSGAPILKKALVLLEQEVYRKEMRDAKKK